MSGGRDIPPASRALGVAAAVMLVAVGVGLVAQRHADLFAALRPAGTAAVGGLYFAVGVAQAALVRRRR